jgi:exonuclease V gamma subunit
MVSYVPELRLLERAGRLPVDDLSQFKSHYAEYLFRKEMSRRFLVDSDNLLIDIEPGTGSALEPFKLAHRSVDVSRAMAERDRLLLENERRRALLAEQRLGDPDIERVTMINGNAATSVIVDGGDGGTP